MDALVSRPTSFVRICARTCLATLIALVALSCTPKQPSPDEALHIDAVRQPLIPQGQVYTGASLGAMQLVISFDGGPTATTSGLSTWLATRPAPIHAMFFVDGACLTTTTLSPNESCVAPLPTANAVLTQLAANGHAIGNRGTTGRDLVLEVPPSERTTELTTTDAQISPHVAWNRFLFRAADGAWGGTSPTPFETLVSTAMNKYIGPVYWDLGGGPTDQTAAATKAADLECWALGYTTRECGDRYLNEARSLTKGIVLLHDGAGDVANHDLDVGTGNTIDLVKYIVPVLEGEGFTFKAIDEVPTIAAALPKCHASCVTCSGPAANQCATCPANEYRSLAGTCVACSACGSTSYVMSACTATANTVCGACDASCTTCSGAGPNACTSCAASHYLDAGTCKPCTSCQPGMFQVSACTTTANTVCSACDASCATCTGPGATDCASCASNKYLGGGACSPCDPSCQTCTGGGANECTSCATGKYVALTGGVGTTGTCDACRVCGANFYQVTACQPTSNTVCEACHPSCTACSGPDISQCGSCPPNFFILDGVCTACSYCTAGSFKAAECTTKLDTICALCPRGTYSNDGASACVACEQGSYASQVGSVRCTACGDCDDHDPCTIDTCSSTQGCMHEVVGNCTAPDAAEIVTAPAPSAPAEQRIKGDSGSDGGCSGAGRGRSLPLLPSVASGLLVLAGVTRRRRRRL